MRCSLFHSWSVHLYRMLLPSSQTFRAATESPHLQAKCQRWDWAYCFVNVTHTTVDYIAEHYRQNLRFKPHNAWLLASLPAHVTNVVLIWLSGYMPLFEKVKSSLKARWSWNNVLMAAAGTPWRSKNTSIFQSIFHCVLIMHEASYTPSWHIKCRTTVECGHNNILHRKGKGVVLLQLTICHLITRYH